MRNIKILGEGIIPEIKFEEKSIAENVDIIKVTAVYPEEIMPEKFTLLWYEENRDAYSTWTPLYSFRRAVFPGWTNAVQVESDANHSMPVFMHLNKASENVFAAALSDCINPVTIKGGIEERTGKIRVCIDFFTKPTKTLNTYEVYIYCNKNRDFYTDTLKGVRDFWKKCGYVSDSVPESAKRSLYSSWYTFQKNVTAEALLIQCREAKKLGMDTVILDDGWQTPCMGGGDAWRAYNTAGDWTPTEEKFPDFKEFVNSVHNMGMKLVLWYAVPFIGKYSRDFKLFENRLLKDRNEEVTVADPRYPDIRKWYVNKLCEGMKAWKLDGFKLDFIDSFQMAENSKIYDSEMDIPDLSSAVSQLMRDIKDALVKINKDVLIEYRQSYIGPEMQKTGNMFRIGDHAYGAMYNRVNGIDMRLLMDCVAVHSDMLMWDYSATAEQAADQLSNILFIVPQISMFLDKLPEEHSKMLGFYLKFIDDNREILLDGDLIPLYPEALYPAVYAQKDGTVISGLYEMNSFKIPDNTKLLQLVNATGNNTVYIDNCTPGSEYEIKNCMGDIVLIGTVNSVLCSFDIPHNGFLSIKI